jgi:hypothetical protein
MDKTRDNNGPTQKIWASMHKQLSSCINFSQYVGVKVNKRKTLVRKFRGLLWTSGLPTA